MNHTRPAAWLMLAIILVALNLRPSMAAIGPLLSALRGDIPLSFSLASLLTMLPVMAMGLAMFSAWASAGAWATDARCCCRC